MSEIPKFDEGRGRYELLKDIATPNGYWRAGTHKDREDWEKIFPGCFDSKDGEDWFFDHARFISGVDMGGDKDLATKVVKEVFEQRGLRSITYHDAAIKACQLFKQRLDQMTIDGLNILFRLNPEIKEKIDILRKPVFQLYNKTNGMYLEHATEDRFGWAMPRDRAKLLTIQEVLECAYQVKTRDSMHVGGEDVEILVVEDLKAHLSGGEPQVS